MLFLGLFLTSIISSQASFAEKLELVVSFQPQDMAFTQILSGQRFEPNSEGFITNSFSFLGRYNLNSESFFEAEHSDTQFRAKTYNTSIFNVRDSKASITQTLLRGFNCKVGELARQRFCWGVEFGKDALPSLQFDDSVNLSMNPAETYILGPVGLVQYPASEEILIQGKIWTSFGVGGSSSARATIKSDLKFGAQVGAVDKISENQSLGFAMDYYVRQSKLETSNSSETLTWNLVTSAVVFHFNYVLSYL